MVHRGRPTPCNAYSLTSGTCSGLRGTLASRRRSYWTTLGRTELVLLSTWVAEPAPTCLLSLPQAGIQAALTSRVWRYTWLAVDSGSQDSAHGSWQQT